MRSTALLLISFFFLAQPAAAVIYQCRDGQGTLVLTDDQDNLPANCRDLQERPEKADLPSEGTTPAAPGARPAGPPAESRQENVQPRLEQQDEEKSPQAAPARKGGGDQ